VESILGQRGLTTRARVRVCHALIQAARIVPTAHEPLTTPRGRRRRWPPRTFAKCSWRLLGPSNKPVTCAIVLISTGYEVRVGYSDDDILRTTLTADIDNARVVAEILKSAIRELGSFSDLDSPA
jgi:hypothetical protein